MVTKFLGFSAKEGMILPVGIVLDMSQIEKNVRGIESEEDDD